MFIILFNFKYDLDGNVIEIENSLTNETTSYDVDEQAVLKSVTKGDLVVSYITDPVGRRIGKKINSVLKEGFVYKDQLNPIAKLDSLGNVVQTYIYLEKFHVPSFMEFDGKVYRLITDHLGSVVAVMDVETGVLIQEVSYDAFGKIVSDTNPGFQPFGFAGGLYDNDTKLLRFGARDYNPEIGRWIQKDPIGFGDTNFYRYVGNDPVNYIDPKGTDRVEVLTKGGVHVGLLIFDPQMPGNNVFIDYGPDGARATATDVFLNRSVPAVVDFNYGVSRNVGVRVPGTHIRQSREDDYRDIMNAKKLQQQAIDGTIQYQMLDFNTNDSSFNCRGFVDRTL